MQLKFPYDLAVIAMIGTAYWFYPTDQKSSSTNGDQTKALSTGKIESLVNASGTLSPVVTVEVGSELNADFNSEVQQGWSKLERQQPLFLTLCALGAIIGISIAALAVYVMNSTFKMSAFIQFDVVLISFGFSALTGIFFDYYPALKASRLQPIDALRYE